jgi:hypothetical protein
MGIYFCSPIAFLLEDLEAHRPFDEQRRGAT